VEWLDFMGSVMGLNSTLWEGKFHRQRKNREIERVRGTDSWLSDMYFAVLCYGKLRAPQTKTEQEDT